MIKKLILQLINKAGYRVEKINPPNEDGEVNSSHLPDKEFEEIFRTINPYTLVDEHRCFELWQLVNQSSKLEGAIIEAGVWKGGTAALFGYSAKKSKTQELVYMCDTFEGVVKASDRDNIYKGGEHSDASHQEVESLLTNKLQLSNFRILKGIFPEETSALIPANSKFRFCHIDVDVYQSAKDILDWIWGKMVIGGMIVFDDYGFEQCQGITDLIDLEERLKEDRLVLTNLNPHALIIKIK